MLWSKYTEGPQCSQVRRHSLASSLGYKGTGRCPASILCEDSSKGLHKNPQHTVENCLELVSNTRSWSEAWATTQGCEIVGWAFNPWVQRPRSAGKVSKCFFELVLFFIAHLTYSSPVVKAQQAIDLDLLFYFCLGWHVQTPASQNRFSQRS